MFTVRDLDNRRHSLGLYTARVFVLSFFLVRWFVVRNDQIVKQSFISQFANHQERTHTQIKSAII